MPPPLKLQISSKQEELLWDRKIFSLQTSSGLIQAVIFYLIKSCGVFLGKDLRQLKTDHVTFGEDEMGQFVTIDFSPIVCHGKPVRHYDDPNNPRSLYKLLKTYIRYLANEGPFLLRPISSIKDYICYSPWPLGVSIIEHMVQTLMEEAGQGSRYGNVSVNLLSLDTLKSYGAGRHCLATWLDCLSGSAYCYKSKVLTPSKVPECSAINCRDRNVEAGLIMSHLLDPPYPASPSPGSVSRDLKAAAEECRDQGSSQGLTSQALARGSDPNQNVRAANSRLATSKDRMRLIKRGIANRVNVRQKLISSGAKNTGTVHSVLHRKQVRPARPRPEGSLNNCGKHITSGSASESSNTGVTMAEIKTELGISPELEIDVASESDPSVAGIITANGEDEEMSIDDDPEELSDEHSSKAEKLDEPSYANKVSNIKRNSGDLELLPCSNLETLRDKSGPREDISDGSGELLEIASDECKEGNAKDKDLNLSESSQSNLNGLCQNKEMCESSSEKHLQAEASQKQEHLTVVSALEQWLGGLKESVKTGTNAEINKLLLQATSQLRDISEQVSSRRLGQKESANCSSITTNGHQLTKTLAARKNSVLDALLIKRLESVQEHTSLPYQDKPSLQMGGLAKAPSSKTMPCEPDVCNENFANGSSPPTSKNESVTEPEHQLLIGDLEDNEVPRSKDNSLSFLKDDSSSVELSPPVLSPQPPTDSASEGSNCSFLFSKSYQQHGNQTQARGKDAKPLHKNPDSQSNSNSEHTKSKVPDLVRFLESANLQVQSLLSSPRQDNTSFPTMDRPAFSESSPHLCGTDSVVSKGTELAGQCRTETQESPAPVVEATDRSSRSSYEDETPSASPPQLTATSQNQQSTWPVLRSVLENSLLPPTSAVSTQCTSPADRSLRPHCSTAAIHSPASSLGETPLVPTPTSAPQASSSSPHNPSPTLAARSGMYTFHSDHAAGAAFQSLTVMSSDKRSQVFTFPDLPLDPKPATFTAGAKVQTDSNPAASLSVRNGRSEMCLGDYLPRGAQVSAQSIKVLTQQGPNGLEVVVRFDFPHTDKSVPV